MPAAEPGVLMTADSQGGACPAPGTEPPTSSRRPLGGGAVFAIFYHKGDRGTGRLSSLLEVTRGRGLGLGPWAGGHTGSASRPGALNLTLAEGLPA